MKNILVTGLAGSGKSTVGDKLKELGYKSYDIEIVDGLFKMIDSHTEEIMDKHNNDDLEEVKRRDWICDVARLQKLLDNQKDDKVFYCGVATNILEVSKLFDKVFILKTSPETIRKRLSSRKSGEYGKTKEVQDWILEGKDWLENMKWDKKPTTIDGEESPSLVTEAILSKI